MWTLIIVMMWSYPTWTVTLSQTTTLNECMGLRLERLDAVEDGEEDRDGQKPVVALAMCVSNSGDR